MRLAKIVGRTKSSIWPASISFIRQRENTHGLPLVAAAISDSIQDCDWQEPTFSTLMTACND